MNAAEPEPPSGVPAPPPWLAGEALGEWARVCEELEPLGYLSRLDRGALVLYCLLWARIAESAQGGEPLKAAEAAQFRAVSASLGLDPCSRAKIHAPTKNEDEDNPFASI